ncbi:MAG: alpha/beta fold hydrolase, partial [Tepidisphaeraceae bacterium]
MPAESVNGTTLNYEQRGKGMPVVLLHAFPLDNRIWQGQLVSLSDRYRVITPDLRGFGKSPSADAFTMDSLAEDVHALLERIGALPCVLGGLSMGGYIAFAFAKKYLSDLRGLVLLDARAEADTAQGKQKRDEMIAAVRTGGSKVAADAMLPKLLADESIHHKPELVRQVKSIMESQPPLTVEHALEALRDREDHVRNLPSIAV